MGIELIEAAFPVRTLSIEPGLHLTKWSGHEVIGAYAPDLLRGHQTTGFEHAEVLLERGQGHVERRGQLRDRRRSLPEPLDDGEPGGVGEPAKDEVERRLLVRHRPNYGAGPLLRSRPF